VKKKILLLSVLLSLFLSGCVADLDEPDEKVVKEDKVVENGEEKKEGEILEKDEQEISLDKVEEEIEEMEGVDLEGELEELEKEL